MKRALIIGINYIGTDNQLNGCINDALNIKKLLITKFNYRPENIIVLNDDINSSENKPTKSNILSQLKKLINLTKNNDTLFFSYSGHGSQVNDLNNDEVFNTDTKGKDDVLCPCDFLSQGFIVDDDLKLLLAQLPVNAKFRSIVDACHSSTMFDLPYLVKNNEMITIESNIKSNCLSFSGCKDSQTSADAYINNTYAGALTFIMIKLLSNVDKVYTTWGSLLSAAQHFMIQENYTQTPMLNVSNKNILNLKIDL